MVDERDRWLAYADTAKQLALEEAPPAAGAPKKVPLAALPIVKKARVAVKDDERPESDIREIPAKLNPRDPRMAPESVPPIDVDTDLD